MHWHWVTQHTEVNVRCRTDKDNGNEGGEAKEERERCLYSEAPDWLIENHEKEEVSFSLSLKFSVFQK